MPPLTKKPAQLPHLPVPRHRVVSPSPYFRWHGALNRLAAALMLIPAAPLIAISVALVRLTSPGQGIYRQTRVGRQGRHFTLYKIRSMRSDAEAATGAVWTTSLRDHRITPVGRFLRWSHLDELPQLWNVLRGEMALIGPRPERPEFTHKLARAIPNYLDRLSVLPGVTGLAQVNLPADTDVDSVRRKLVLDLEYVESATLFLDVRIAAATCLRMLGIRGALARQFLGLQRSPGVVSAPQHAREEVFAHAPSAASVE